MDLSLEMLSSSDFAESGESLGKEVRTDALNRFLDVGKSLFAIANFPSAKFPVVELFLLRSIFSTLKLRDNTTPRVIPVDVLIEDVLESLL